MGPENESKRGHTLMRCVAIGVAGLLIVSAFMWFLCFIGLYTFSWPITDPLSTAAQFLVVPAILSAAGAGLMYVALRPILEERWSSHSRRNE